jgi:hypothetical protein
MNLVLWSVLNLVWCISGVGPLINGPFSFPIPIPIPIPLFFGDPPVFFILLIGMASLQLYLLFPFLLLILRLLVNLVGRRPCERNFTLFKRITPGILFLVLLVFDLLGVNGSILLSFGLMER